MPTQHLPHTSHSAKWLSSLFSKKASLTADCGGMGHMSILIVHVNPFDMPLSVSVHLMNQTIEETKHLCEHEFTRERNATCR